MKVHILLLVCIVLIQCIPVHKKFLQLDGNEKEDISNNLQNINETQENKDVQILAAKESDLMINQLDESQKQSTTLDDETPLNSAYFEDEDLNEVIQDASQNIVEDLKLIGQYDNNNLIEDENHQIIDTQQLIDDNDNYVVSDTMNVNDEIQQEIQESQNNQDTTIQQDNFYDDQIDVSNETLQAVDDEQQQQLIQQEIDISEMNQEQIIQEFTQPEYEVQTQELEQTNLQDQTIIIDNSIQNEDNQNEENLQAETEVDPNNVNDVSSEDNSQCIELYSQCYYKGETMKACNDLGQMKDFPYDIKSLKIPHGTTLTIYDHPNYEGEKHTFSRSEECLNNVIVLSQIAF